MRKLNLNPRELKALYPSMSEAFHRTVQSTLHDLERGKERTVVKKKMPAALIFAVILVIATLSVAYALTQSNLLKTMFGSGTQVPKELEEAISKPEATVSTPDVKVTLSEYLYDGEKLHVYLNIANQTDRQIMVTMTPFMVNGLKLNTERVELLQSNTGHSWGQILSGEVNGIAMPDNMSYYNIYINPWIYMQGYSTFTKGETLEIISDLYIWELLSPPDLIVPETWDGKTLHGIPTNRSGVCGPGWFFFKDTSMDFDDARANLSIYEKNGWARIISKQPVKFSITLDTRDIKQAKPLKTALETDYFTLNITKMVYMPTGGTIVLHLVPTAHSRPQYEGLFWGYNFAVLNADTKELLSNSTPLTIRMSDYTDYTLTLVPVAGELPKAILIVPTVNAKDNDSMATTSPHNDSPFIYVMENAVEVGLEWQ